jgi:hypothetical protein
MLSLDHVKEAVMVAVVAAALVLAASWALSKLEVVRPYVELPLNVNMGLALAALIAVVHLVIGLTPLSQRYCDMACNSAYGRLAPSML